jgi:aldehyde:ferredoxin oxidoreductase
MKNYGYNGKIARINLSTEEITIEEPDWVFYRTYFGGRGIVAYYLLKELSPEVDPLSKDNKIIVAASVITGAPLPGFSRHSIGAKSPQTGLFGESEAGGYWGPDLKKAGFDALIVEGAADRPVYLFIRDGSIEIRSAENLWGLDTGETLDRIRNEVGDEKVRFLGIGKAGENLVRYAGVTSDLHHYHGRTGLGAVMGSKKLKAIAVRGTKKIEFYDEKKVKDLFKWFAENMKTNVDNLSQREFGTSAYYYNAQQAGLLPTRNFSTTWFDVKETVEEVHQKMKDHREGCFACTVQCKQAFKLEEPFSVDPRYGGPEFETFGSFNSICGVDDAKYVAKAHELCNRYGMDTISCGVTISWAMECFEKGLLTVEDTGGIKIEFGNGDVMLQLIELIADRKGIGDLLAEGSKTASEKIGRGSSEYAMQVKGLEFPMAEPRVKFGLGLAYAISPTGADHLQHEHDGAFDPQLTGYSHNPDDPYGMVKHLFPFGILSPVKALSIGWEKVRLVTYFQHFWSFFECIDTCIFTWAPVRTWRINHMPEIIEAVTGWETSLFEVMKVGERATTLTRCFNLKHGLSTDDDSLPKRMFEKLSEGPMKDVTMNEDEMKDAVKLYYGMMGWDENTGIPTRGKLAELNIPWAVNHLLPKKNE